jgi:hypothetical protein
MNREDYELRAELIRLQIDMMYSILSHQKDNYMSIITYFFDRQVELENLKHAHDMELINYAKGEPRKKEESK